MEASPELLSMTVDIGGGRKGTISVCETDDPDALARNFVEEHSLELSMTPKLSFLIQYNKELAESRQSGPDEFNWSEYKPPVQESPVKPRQHSKASNVYSRLYKQGKRDVRRTASAVSMNYGEWLYRRSQEKKTKKEQNDKNVEAVEDYPYKPTINEYSNLLAPRFYEKTEDLLNRKGQEYKERREERASRAIQDELKECSFSPQLGKKTLSLASAISVPAKSAQHLETKRRLQEIQKTAEPLSNASDNKPKRTPNEQEDYADRLIEYGQKNFEKREKDLEELTQSLIPSFQPQTGRAPADNESREAPIHEYLYAKRNNRNEKNAEIEAQMQSNTDAVARSEKISKNSANCYEEFRGKQYAKLFTMLDSDNDGVISSEHISIDALDDRSLEILAPLLGAIESGGEMDIESFVGTLEDLWKTLNVGDKAHLLRRERREEVSPEKKALVSSKSKSLAVERNSLMSVDMSERLKHAQMITELKRQKMKELLETETMKDCSFRPVIKKYKRKN